MEVILREDVPAVGKAGEIVKVAEGYGRNYLFPHKKAVPVTPGNLKQLEQQKQAIESRREKLKKEAEDLAQKITGVTVVLAKQAGEEDKIFGSVSTREIAAQLEGQGIKLDRRVIRIATPIKTTGEHTVEVHLHGDVVAPLKIVVQKK